MKKKLGSLSYFAIEMLRRFDRTSYEMSIGMQTRTCRSLADRGLMDRRLTEDEYRTNDAGREALKGLEK